MDRALREERLPMNSKFFFMHVPKTAGMTVRQVMRINNVKMLVVDDYSQLALLSDRQLHDYEAVTGHIGFRLLNRYPDAFTFTFLRHPVARIISMYKYWVSSNQSYQARLALQGGVASFLRNPQEGVRMEVDNGQTWQTAIDRAPWIRTAHATTADDELLAIAKDNLLRMDFVGLHETFEHDLKILASHLGWRMDDAPRENVTPELVDEAISQQHCETIQGMNQLDLQLYAFASEHRKNGYWVNRLRTYHSAIHSADSASESL